MSVGLTERVFITKNSIKPALMDLFKDLYLTRVYISYPGIDLSNVRII